MKTAPPGLQTAGMVLSLAAVKGLPVLRNVQAAQEGAGGMAPTPMFCPGGAVHIGHPALPSPPDGLSRPHMYGMLQPGSRSFCWLLEESGMPAAL